MTIHPITVGHFIKKMDSLKSFHFPKLLHGFWEHIAEVSGSRTRDGIKRDLREYCDRTRGDAVQFSATCPRLLKNHHNPVNDYYIEVIDGLCDQREDIMWGVHAYCYDQFPPSGAQLAPIMDALVPGDLTVYDGRVFKDAHRNGSILRLFDFLRRRRWEVVVTGLEHLRDINRGLRFEHFHFLPAQMPLSHMREDYLGDLRRFHRTLGGRPAVYLMQLGGLAPWVIHRIGAEVRNTFLLDVGRGLDVWCDMDTVPMENPAVYWSAHIPPHLMAHYQRGVNSSAGMNSPPE